jgi:hypothetical protein
MLIFVIGAGKSGWYHTNLTNSCLDNPDFTGIFVLFELDGLPYLLYFKIFSKF